MIVACPNCQTRFNVATAALQPDGRQVRCSRCHYSWFQPLPEEEEPPPPPPRRQAAPPRPAPARERPARPAPPPEEPPAMEAIAESEPPELDDDAPADWDDLDADTQPGSYDLDDMAGEPIPQLPIQTRARAQQRRRAQQKSRSAVGWYALAAAIAGVVALLYFARGELVELWPPIERLYVTAGIDLPVPPLTLDFRDTATSFEDDDTTLVVAGRVLNSGSAAQAVPPVEVVLLDAAGAVLATRAVRPGAASLAPGADTGFTVRFEDFPPAVADLRLSFQPLPR